MEILLAAVLAAALVLCFILLIRLLRVKNKLHDISDILDDISAGNGNHRILENPKDMTAAICYKLNEIVYHYEEQLAHKNQESEANKQLMTSLAHDVRTPLTTLIGYLDASHKGIVQGKEREDYIETARKKAHELKEYIDDLFAWFKLGSDEEAFVIQQQVMAMIDFDGYSRILNNLIQNVLAHSEANHILISVSCQSKKVEICIADDGIGISKQDLCHIFERLYKCDKARSEHGSGLGLHIAKELTAKMNGTITASSETNQYTAFTLLFPLTD